MTGFLHRLSFKFDPHTAVSSMMEGPCWAEKKHKFINTDGRIKSADEIISAWSQNGEVQRARGTLLHYHAEQFLNGRTIEEPQVLDQGVLGADRKNKSEVNAGSNFTRVELDLDALDDVVLPWFWCYAKMLHSLQEVLHRLQGWGEDCSCCCWLLAHWP